MSSENISPYYKDSSGRISLASRVSYSVRKKIFELFTAVMRPAESDSVLDIGVTSDTTFRESNFFEQFYPFKERIVCVGTENASHLESLYPGVRFVSVKPGAPLPFDDKQFDIVFSNAVVEHAGSLEDQRRFIAEACRVGRRVFITTPNRWFPVEHHSAVPLLHYLPKSVYRGIISRTALSYWADERNLNLLTRTELAALFPANCPVEVTRIGVGFGPFRSNLAAYSNLSRSGGR